MGIKLLNSHSTWTLSSQSSALSLSTQLNWTELIWTQLNWTKLNSTQLNWMNRTELNSTVSLQYIEPATTSDDPQWFSEEIGDRHRFFSLILVNRPIKATFFTGRKLATSWDDRWQPSQVYGCQEPVTAVTCRRSSSPVRCTTENWTQLNSTEPVQTSAVHWA